MAKYSRFDPRNKKRNKHKERAKNGLGGRKMHLIDSDAKYYDSKNVQSYN
jgi:hypothetical protein